VNDGRGWECKRCRDEDASASEGEAHEGKPSKALEGKPSSNTLPRFFREGEAEERETRLASSALARWKDDARRTLVCTRCRAEEDLHE